MNWNGKWSLPLISGQELKKGHSEMSKKDKKLQRSTKSKMPCSLSWSNISYKVICHTLFFIFKRTIYLRNFYWIFSTSTSPFIIKIIPRVHQHHLLSASNQNNEKSNIQKETLVYYFKHNFMSFLCHGMKLDIR